MAVETNDTAFGVAAVVDVRESQGLEIVFEIVIFLQTLERAMPGKGATNREAICVESVVELWGHRKGGAGGRGRTVGNHTGHLPGQRPEGDVFPSNQGLVIGQRGEVLGNGIVDVDATAQQDGILVHVRCYVQSVALCEAMGIP